MTDKDLPYFRGMEFKNDGLRDSLTGLIAPNLFYESAERMKSWSDRSGQALSMIAIEFNQPTEDELVHAARMMSAELRGGDLLARLGELSFALLLVGDHESAQHVIFRLENTVKPKANFRFSPINAREPISKALDRVSI